MDTVRRLIAILMLLGSQVAASTMVVCEEGDGRQVIEVLSGGCCAPGSDLGDGSGARPALDDPTPDSCGSCQDVVVVQSIDRGDRWCLDVVDLLSVSAVVVGVVVEPLARALPTEAGDVPQSWVRSARHVVLLI